MNPKINWDAFGIATSMACAIHCALLPLFLTSLPLFGMNIIENAAFEYLMIGLAFCIGAFALYHGRKKHHHSWWPLLVFSFGMLLLAAKMIWHEWHLWFLFPAVTCIITAHYINYRLYRNRHYGQADNCAH